jgi:RNA polymerase sigma-70 factor (ECF subfamily)
MNPQEGPQSFQTTRWSVVRRALGADDSEASLALAALCEAYWYPLYAYIRRSGKTPHDAEDLTQGFFARMLERGILASADPDKGKLRTFLLSCMRNYLADERDRAMAQKRGAALLINFDPALAEVRYASELVDDLSPDRLFQRRWALTLLDYTLQFLAAEFTAQGKGRLFHALRPFLGFGPDPENGYDKIAAALGMPVGTLKNEVFRLRQRWRKRLFEQVGMTLDNPTPDNIKDELKELLCCV